MLQKSRSGKLRKSRSVMASRRTVICLAGVFIAVGIAESQAGGPPSSCKLEIEVNALRGGSPTVTAGADSTRDITAKARIAKGTAPSGTTINTTLRIEAVDDGTVIHSQSFFPVQLEVGKGGQGQKLEMKIEECISGSIDFVATFFGKDATRAECEGSDTITKICK
jgi:hypothetical protein